MKPSSRRSTAYNDMSNNHVNLKTSQSFMTRTYEHPMNYRRLSSTSNKAMIDDPFQLENTYGTRERETGVGEATAILGVSNYILISLINYWTCWNFQTTRTLIFW